MLSIILPVQINPECLESLYTFTHDPEFEILGEGAGRFPFHRVETKSRSYVQAANRAAASAKGEELIFVKPDFIATSTQWTWDCFSIPTALFRQAGGFNEHFSESCHDIDLCRRLNLPDPPANPAQDPIDQLLLADLWPAP